ncbi:MAG: hypothetical protein HF978_14080 [Desulfobacteraceae bacterium]|nr:hypothetical protein [Desulfobacteraceae bacterium]MBC2756667.1 hypothetical protein [Desulfobacteraceae bacterium]
MIRSKKYLILRIISLPFLGLCISICCLSGILFPSIIFAATINGANYQCTELIPENGDILSGTFTNVQIFRIDAGVTVFVEPATTLSISAESINIQGILDGVGAGFSGGTPSLDPATAGGPGEGPGGGEGGLHGSCVHASGGGGGAYGGDGGNSGQALSSPPAALGGTAYGNINPPGVDMGSGGGAAGNHCESYNSTGGAGGAGGAAISLTGNIIDITGSVLADGAAGSQGVAGSTYGAPGGGGGSGGGIEICGQTGSIIGIASANGGIGADGIATSSQYEQGGGGGGGGRIKISASINTSGATFSVSGGVHGASAISSNTAATDGQIGTVYLDGPGCSYSCSAAESSIPTMTEWGMVVLSLLLCGVVIFRMKRRPTV